MNIYEYHFFRSCAREDRILKRHGIEIEKKFIELVVTETEKLEEGYKNRLIAQKEFDDDHVLRVVYERINSDILIITIYP
ncbi:MAG: DUF4258 domain-containing protein [bacterium]